MDYYPWGGELQFVSGDSNHYKFTGKERDGETGMDYFGARYYGNWLGRFVTPDWAAKPATVPYADLKDPQSLNLYSYVRNRPIARFDVDGHFQSSNNKAPQGACGEGNKQCPPPDTDDWMEVGQNTVTVTHWEQRQYYVPDQTDSNGTVTPDHLVVTTTETSAVFSREKGHEGQFLGATTYTDATKVTGNGPQTTTSSTKIDYGKAALIIGATNLEKAATATNPGLFSLTAAAMWQTVRDHPVKVGAGSAAVLGGTLSLPTNPRGGIVGIITGVTTLWCAANGPGC